MEIPSIEVTQEDGTVASVSVKDAVAAINFRAYRDVVRPEAPSGEPLVPWPSLPPANYYYAGTQFPVHYESTPGTHVTPTPYIPLTHDGFEAPVPPMWDTTLNAYWHPPKYPLKIPAAVKLESPFQLTAGYWHRHPHPDDGLALKEYTVTLRCLLCNATFSYADAFGASYVTFHETTFLDKHLVQFFLPKHPDATDLTAELPFPPCFGGGQPAIIDAVSVTYDLGEKDLTYGS